MMTSKLIMSQIILRKARTVLMLCTCIQYTLTDIVNDTLEDNFEVIVWDFE